MNYESRINIILIKLKTAGSIMPNCHICRGRIDLSQKGVRVLKCKKCGKITCSAHILTSSGFCFGCAERPVPTGKTPFSFIRKPGEEQKTS
jgi:hypothetical protein